MIHDIRAGEDLSSPVRPATVRIIERLSVSGVDQGPARARYIHFHGSKPLIARYEQLEFLLEIRARLTNDMHLLHSRER